MSNRRPCEIEGCAGVTGNKTGGARGLCSKHYRRLKLHGDPLYVMPMELIYGTLEERLWAKVDKTGTCWLWTGGTALNGYGRLRTSPGWTSVHRLSYEIHHGAIPDGLMVLHSCDVRNCVTPGHLRLGTAADNAADAVSRNRHDRSPKVWKLTPEQVRVIRHRRAAGATYPALAAEYGVAKNTVWKAATGLTWREVS